jgi:cell filamentation protein
LAEVREEVSKLQRSFFTSMANNTNWTPSAEDNLLNLTDKNAINEEEAKGIANAEFYVLGLDIDLPISAALILDVHKTAFAHLYDWAGKWRNTNIIVGQFEPPQPQQIIQLVYQFADNLNYKISIANTKEEHVECLLYSHYEFIRIHPFNNGNGRTGRILMNLVAMKLGYQPLVLYHREGESRMIYIDAMKAADKGDIEPLRQLISIELTTF